MAAINATMINSFSAYGPNPCSAMGASRAESAMTLAEAIESETAMILPVPLAKTAAQFPEICKAADMSGAASRSRTGLNARAGWFPTNAPDGPKAIYVLFVGTAEAIEKHEPAVRDVLARGNDLLVFEFPGQGGSGRFLADPRKVHAPRDGFDMWTACIREFLRSPAFRAVRQRAARLDIDLVALAYSLGGHMFARMTLETPAFAHKFSRIVYANPVVAMNTAGSMATRIAQQWLARLRLMTPGRADDFLPGHGRFHPGNRPLAKSGIGSDAERHAWVCQFYHAHPELSMWGMTYGWFNEANRSLTKLWDLVIEGEAKNRVLMRWRPWTGAGVSGPKRPSNVTRVPTLVISSERDAIVVAHYVQRFARYVGADLLHLPTAKHEPSQEPPQIREATFDAVGAWVANPMTPGIDGCAAVTFKPGRGRAWWRV